MSQLDNITKGLSSLKHIKKVDNLDREMTKNIECDEGPIKGGGVPTFEPKIKRHSLEIVSENGGPTPPLKPKNWTNSQKVAAKRTRIYRKRHREKNNVLKG